MARDELAEVEAPIGDTTEQTDHLTRAGAEALAQRIREFWAASGAEVWVTVTPRIYGRNRIGGVGITSNLRGGLPRGWSGAAGRGDRKPGPGGGAGRRDPRGHPPAPRQSPRLPGPV